jgi:hypothetical protein
MPIFGNIRTICDVAHIFVDVSKTRLLAMISNLSRNECVDLKTKIKGKRNLKNYSGIKRTDVEKIKTETEITELKGKQYEIRKRW